MKKTYKFLTFILLILIFTLSLAGCNCNFRDPNNPGGVNPEDSSLGIDQTTPCGALLEDLPLSSNLSNTVAVGYGSEQNQLSIEDAVDRVYTSVVTVALTVDNGTHWGSGVIVDLSTANDLQGDYFVITCYHVIRNTGELSVYLIDDKMKNYDDPDYNTDYVFKGAIGQSSDFNSVELIGADSVADIAVLKLSAKNREEEIKQVDAGFTSLDLSHVIKSKVAPSDRAIKLGQSVFAVGNPFGKFPGTVMSGIVGHLQRPSEVNTIGPMTLIQIDAMTAQGNSGGGLYNLYGELIGITNAGVYSEENGNNGINFAIPASVNTYLGIDNGFINVAKNLIATKTQDNFGYVSYRWNVGATVGSTNQGKVYVASIVKDGDAYLAGLKANDVIAKITYLKNGVSTTENITSLSAYEKTVSCMRYYLKIGDSFTLTVDRASGVNGFSVKSERKEITFNITRQWIFADTGIYAQN